MKGDIKLEIDLVKELLVNAESDHVVIKLSAWLGKDKEGKGQYFNVSFFLNADQFDLIPNIENKETIRLVGGLKVEKYVGKDGTPAVNLQVAYPDISLVSKDANVNDANEISPLDDYSDDMEPF